MKRLTKDSTVRTRDGRAARIICDDAIGPHPIIALVKFDGQEFLYAYDVTGANAADSSRDLIEISPYADFKIDDPVMIRFNKGGMWTRAHFSGVNEDGRPMVFDSMQTSFTTTGTFCVKECRRPTEEELRGEK